MSRFSQLAALLPGLMGVGFLSAWLVGGRAGQFASQNMKTNTALCLVLLGGALLLMTRGRRRGPVRLLSLLAGLVGLLTFTQHLTGLDLGLDQLLVADPWASDARFPNRMSPPAALSFLLLGPALALAPGGRRAVLASQLLCAMAMGVAGLTLIGYLYEASYLYRPTSFIRFSQYTAAGVLVLAAGALVLRPDVGLPRRFSGEGAGSLLARRLLLVIALLPVLLGWLRLWAMRHGLFDDSAGTALLVIATIAVLAAVLFVLARSLDHIDAQRATSEAQLRQSSELIAALARAHTVDDVAAATVDLGLSALGARAGSLLLLDETGTQLVMHRSLGYNPAVRDQFSRIPVDADLPVCQAVRERQPVFIGDPEENLRRYPGLRPEQLAPEHGAWAALPLEGRDRALGVIGLSFAGQQSFDAATRDHFRRLASQCGQALERALLLAQAQEARAGAESASRAKDEFLAMLGHELRNPLSPIVSALHLMQLRGGTQLQKERATIERQVRHMVRLVDDLMDVSRITRGKIELRRRPVDLPGAITAALEVVSPLLEQQRHRLQVDVPAGLELDADPERLSQIIANLLSNAAKYTEPGGEIRVTAHQEGEAGPVALSVSDNGAGIAPELLPRVFELFVQGGRTIERAQGGLGLGLAIVKSLVQLHGGTVEAASPGPGQGSTFTVRLPAAPALAARTEEVVAAAPAPAGVRRRILVVDDNRDAAEALSEALQSEGHEVQVAFDGAAAVAAGEAYRPAVVFLDIGLPVMDGYEVARKLRALDHGYRPLLVAISGYGQASDRARALEAGFDQHLVKPVAVEITLALAAGDHASPADA